MSPRKSEFVFLTVIAIVSCSFCWMIGFQFIHPVEVKALTSIDQKKVRNLTQYHSWKQEASGEIHFINGIPYLMGGYPHSVEVSSFYQRNLNLIPTSFYWKHPLSDGTSRLIIGTDHSVQLITTRQHELPLLSLIVEPDDFFSYENGIYVQGQDSDFSRTDKFYPFPWHRPANYYRSQNDERKIFFSYYNEAGKVLYSSYARAEISGKATRCFPQKSIRLSANKDLGSKKFKFDFFQDGNEYETLILRNGGNDNTKSFFRDMLMQTLMRGTGLMTSSFQPCIVYLNGQYWGIHFLQNRMDDNLVAERMNCKEKKVTIVENWQLDKGSEMEYKKLIRHIRNKKVTSEILYEIIDKNDMINYIAGQIYFANTDWPENNFRMYQIKGDAFGSKWKFAFFDLDYGFGYTGEESVSFDMFAFLLGKNDNFSWLFKVLMKQDEFKSALKVRLKELMQKELSEGNLVKKIGEFESLLESSIVDHTARWRKPDSFSEWKKEVDLLREFAANRNAAIHDQIKKYLE